MRHQENGVTCAQLTRPPVLHRDPGLTGFEVTCVHGFTWYELVTPAEPSATRGRPCTYCGEPVESTGVGLRFGRRVHEACSASERSRSQEIRCCAYCDKPLASTNGGKRYCDRRCRDLAYADRLTRNANRAENSNRFRGRLESAHA